MLDTLNRSATFINITCDVYEYISKQNKYKNALVLLILHIKTNQNKKN